MGRYLWIGALGGSLLGGCIALLIAAIRPNCGILGCFYEIQFVMGAAIGVFCGCGTVAIMWEQTKAGGGVAYLLLSARELLEGNDVEAAQSQIANISPAYLAKLKTPLDLWTLAKLAYANQHLLEAADYVKRLFAQGAPNVDIAAEARLLLARITYKQGNGTETETYLQAAEALQPSSSIVNAIQALRSEVTLASSKLHE